MSTWTKREDCGTNARIHTNRMEKEYHDQITQAALNTCVYSDNVQLPGGKGAKAIMTNIAVVPTDSVTAIIREASKYQQNKIAVMNFASFKYPGGAFLDGSMAQEEALCHKSFLYNVLEKQSSFYEENQFKLDRGLYQNRALYSPDILFFGDHKTVKCDVITCAAPNRSVAERYQKVSPEENFSVLKSRIKFVLDIAEYNHVDTLIAGAFGCGVFRQDPIEVSNIFKELLETENYNFINVIFAIPGGSNYEAFDATFNR